MCQDPTLRWKEHNLTCPGTEEASVTGVMCDKGCGMRRGCRGTQVSTGHIQCVGLHSKRNEELLKGPKCPMVLPLNLRVKEIQCILVQ